MPLPPHAPELADLDLMVSVAETGSVGRAAARHRISQPAASQRLQPAGTPTRACRCWSAPPAARRLTPAGEVFVGWARKVLDEAARLADAVQALRGAAVGPGAGGGLAHHRRLARARLAGGPAAGRPGTRVSLRVGNSAAVVDLVLRQSVALGFIEAPVAPAGLRSRTVGGDRLVVVDAGSPVDTPPYPDCHCGHSPNPR